MKNRQLPGIVVVISEKDLMEEAPREQSKTQTKKLNEERKRELLVNLNALINEGGGSLCLHVENSHMLGKFDQIVNVAMAALVPDDTLFQDNFERHVDDKNHIIFRVKQRRRLLSTYSFNTKISHDKGSEDPTHGQMRQFMNREEGEDDETRADDRTEDYTFKKDREVEVEVKRRRRKVQSVFQESVSIQAKKIPKTFPHSADRGLKIADLFFDTKPESRGIFLPKYITAFSKLRRGGSIFLGLYEESMEVPKWSPVKESEKNELLSFKKPEYNLWKDDDVYLIAKENPPGKDTVHTGLFISQGITLTKTEQRHFRDQIKTMIKEIMYWHPHQFPGDESRSGTGEATATVFQPPVDVKFHPVENGSQTNSAGAGPQKVHRVCQPGDPTIQSQDPAELVVVEINVLHYPGVAFLDSKGPEAFHFPKKDEDGTVELERMGLDLWFEKIKECNADLED